MGFADYARTVLSNNRKLRKSIRDRRFGRKTNVVNPLLEKTVTSLSEQKIEKSNNKKRRSIIRVLVGFTILFLILAILGFFTIEKGIPKLIEKYNLNKSRIIERENEKREEEAYFYWVSKGNQKLEKGQFPMAYKDFMAAIGIRKNGKRANYGITLCLMRECKEDNTNCELSKEYYNKLINSGQLNWVELEKLDSYR